VTVGLLITGNRQIKLARDEFTATHRPWLLVGVEVASGLDWSMAEGHNGLLHVNVTVENIRETPARLVRGTAFLHPGHAEYGDPIDRQKALAVAFHTRTADADAGITLFPRKTKALAIGPLMIDRQMTKRWSEWMKAFDVVPEVVIASRIPPAYIIGCVEYASTFGDSTFQSGFIRELTRIELPNTGTRIHIDPRKGPVTAMELQLRESILGDGVMT
jgi:hypothetical protein